MQALPTDIYNLPQYIVPNQIFICTCIIFIFFLIWTIGMLIIWSWRSYKHIHNYDYVVDHNIRRQFQNAQKTYKQNMEKEREEQDEGFHSEAAGGSSVTNYSPELEKKQMIYNRQESRLLELACLSVVVAININSFSCGVMEVVAYVVAVLAFTLFNVFRVAQSIKYLRLVFFIPLLVAYLPFFIFKKELHTI